MHLSNIPQHTATHRNTPQHTATHRSTLQRTATHRNTPQRTATHRNTLQHTAALCKRILYMQTRLGEEKDILFSCPNYILNCPKKKGLASEYMLVE